MTISRGILRHWTDIASRSAGDRSHRLSYKEQVASVLIGFAWIRGEADKRGMVVTRAEIDRSLRRQRRHGSTRSSPSSTASGARARLAGRPG